MVEYGKSFGRGSFRVIVSNSQQVFVVLGNQLFPRKYFGQNKSDSLFFMAEDRGLCTHFRYHKHKIIFFLSAMRHFAEDLKNSGYKLTYEKLDAKNSEKTYEDKLSEFLKKKKAKKVVIFEIEDKFFEKRMMSLFEKLEIEVEVRTSPMFLFERSVFKKYNESVKRPFMKSFYEQRRKDSGVLMTAKGEPKGGQFSFDSENRKKLPKKIEIPRIDFPKRSKITEAVIRLVDSTFAEHPGKTDEYWIPSTREEALNQLDTFVEKRLDQFGDYQDALHSEHDFNFHSVLSPYLNAGLLTPDEVIQKIAAQGAKLMNSVEGFVRQVLGWREFVRGVYQEYSEVQDKENFFGHSRKMSAAWYKGETGIPPLDDCIKKALRLSYCHHIERLMVLSNFMLLSEIKPREVHRWFMEMFVDSSDWVMGPNVYGMGQFSDGGIFATKPYISGSNYILKMSNYGKADWCEVHDGLFWSFLEKNSKFFKKNHRMSMLMKNLEKMDPQKKSRIFEKANNFRDSVTC